MGYSKQRTRCSKKKIAEWVAWLICKGHANAYEYGINFLQTSINQAFSIENNNIVKDIYSHRVSRLSGKDYASEIKKLSNNNTKFDKVDHEENLRKYGKHK